VQSTGSLLKEAPKKSFVDYVRKKIDKNYEHGLFDRLYRWELDVKEEDQEEQTS
jgi:hypothetical protein